MLDRLYTDNSIRSRKKLVRRLFDLTRCNYRLLPRIKLFLSLTKVLKELSKQEKAEVVENVGRVFLPRELVNQNIEP